MSIGTTTIRQINFVVKDVEKVKNAWIALTGKKPVMEYYLWDFNQVPAFTDGQPEDCDDVKAVKFTLNDEEGGSPVTLAFWQPGNKETPWKKYLEEHGEGFMDLEFTVPDLQKAYECIGRKPYHEGYYSVFTYSFIHGIDKYATDLNIGQAMDNTEKLAELKKVYPDIEPLAFK